MTRALPLQILLALALVLNGIGGAMAAVLAALPVLPDAPVAVETADPAAQPGDCGDHASGGHAPLATELPPPAADCHSGDDAGCGDTPECRQACMHAAAALPPSTSAAQLQPGARVGLHPLAAGHPAPPLRGPIRPPIA